MNAGLAWLFAAAALGPMPFVMLCAGVFGVGALVYLAALVQILQSRPSHLLVWDARILLCSVLMIPVAVGLLVFSAWQRLMIPPPDPAAAGAIASEAADAASGPLPFEFLPADGGTVLTMLLAVLVPAVVAVMFQLVRLQSQGPTNPESFRARLGNQILLASYFNYAVGVLMVIPAAWVGIERILTLGTLFLLVGALGFLGNYFFLARKQPAEKSEAGEPGLEATPAA
jgi:hypothetical protein